MGQFTLMKIHIEFCIKWNYEPEFDRVSKEIHNINSSIEIKGNESSPRTGSFEVSINNILVYSKFKTGVFPTVEEIKSWFN